MARPLLEVEHLSRSFGGLQAVRDLSFHVEEGRIQAVIGPNGAGKTTVFNLIAGALRPNAGTITFRGERIAGRPPHQVAARGIARTFQTTRLFQHMTVLENVQVGRHRRSRCGFLAGLLNLPATWREERAIREHALRTIERLGLADLAHQPAGSLDFGNQRRVELARALAGEPALLLLDEPAAGLNITETEVMAGLISDIRAQGVTVLLVEHDMSLVMGISDHVVVLDHGGKIAEGPPGEMQKHPDVIRVYLGDDDA